MGTTQSAEDEAQAIPAAAAAAQSNQNVAVPKAAGARATSIASGVQPKRIGSVPNASAANIVKDGSGPLESHRRANTTGPTGDAYLDHGAVCGTQASNADCFLAADARTRVVDRFVYLVGQAGGHFNNAIADLRMETLVEKEDDLNWVVGLVLDLVTAHLVSALVNATLHLRDGAIGDEASKLALDESTWRPQLKAGLAKITERHVQMVVKTTLDAGKKSAQGGLKHAQNAHTSNTKAETISYLDQLRNEAELGFDRIATGVPARGNDTELIAFLHAFEGPQHTTLAYKAPLAEKLERYKQSGVTKISRWNASTGYMKYADDWQLWNEHGGDATDEAARTGYHDAGTYVVWHTYVSGAPKELAFQHHGRTDPSRGTLGPRHGGENGIDYSASSNSLVPREFEEVALARHEAVWGSQPGTELIDDSAWYWAPERAAKAAANKRSDPFLVTPKTSDEIVAAARAKGESASQPIPQPIDIPAALTLKPAGGGQP